MDLAGILNPTDEERELSSMYTPMWIGPKLRVLCLPSGLVEVGHVESYWYFN